MKNRSLVYFTLITAFIGFVIIFASGTMGQTKSQIDKKLDCTECHTCQEPTASDKCLRTCPSLSAPEADAKHSLKEAPDKMTLDKLVNQYQPVQFNHKLHAGMAEMGADCGTCHHYSPPGQIPPCGECHGGARNPINMRQPSLKGAYHRQCMSCHREWSHETKCVLCHLPSDVDAKTMTATDSTDILGAPHPVITPPEIEIYHTSFVEGPIVTFHHNEHVELFDIRCVDCHKKENCGNCHDLARSERKRKTLEEVHSVCSSCHTDAICEDCPHDETCMKCHDTVEKPAFSHKEAEWKLTSYHTGLACRNCHPTGREISSLNADCNSCHAGWNQGNFRHSVTGLNLDELHLELECGDCHTDLKYHEKPACDNCHDDGRDYNKMPPGVYVK